MPFPQLPSSSEVASTFKFIMIGIFVVLPVIGFIAMGVSEVTGCAEKQRAKEKRERIERLESELKRIKGG